MKKPRHSSLWASMFCCHNYIIRWRIQKILRGGVATVVCTSSAQEREGEDEDPKDLFKKMWNRRGGVATPSHPFLLFRPDCVFCLIWILRFKSNKRMTLNSEFKCQSCIYYIPISVQRSNKTFNEIQNCIFQDNKKICYKTNIYFNLKY